MIVKLLIALGIWCVVACIGASIFSFIMWLDKRFNKYEI